MSDVFMQLGLGGILALLVIREVFQFLAGWKADRNGLRSRDKLVTAGSLTPDYWQAEQRKAIVEVVTVTIVPLLANQTLILNELRVAHVDMNKNIAILLERFPAWRHSDGAGG